MTARFAFLLLMFAGLVGCGTDPGPGGRAPKEPPPPPMPPLAGTSLFYGGRLECRVKVSFSRLRPHGSGGTGGGGRSGQVTGGVQGNGGGRGSNVGGGAGYDAGPANVGVGTNGSGGNLGVGMGGRGGGSRAPRTSDEDSDAPTLSLAALGPPATLYLRFTNRGKERIEVEVLDFASQFGNFAVQPDKVALEPGQWVEAEPMSSQILNTSGDVTVKIRLRSGEQKETQMVALVPEGPS